MILLSKKNLRKKILSYKIQKEKLPQILLHNYYQINNLIKNFQLREKVLMIINSLDILLICKTMFNHPSFKPKNKIFRKQNL